MRRSAALVAVVALVAVLAIPASFSVTPAAAVDPSPAAGGESFTDVEETNPFVGDIDWLAAADITGGFPDGGFHPTTVVSRQTMSAFLHSFWRLVADYTGPSPNPGLDDVAVLDPFFAEIWWMVDAGVAEGYADNTFGPTNAVTRQTMAAFIQRLWIFLGNTADLAPDPGFTDLSPGDPFFAEIAWLVDTGIADGFLDNTYRPTDPVTRQAMAGFISRLFELVTNNLCTDQTQISRSECTALVALWNYLEGWRWPVPNGGWMTSLTPCSWVGISCGINTTTAEGTHRVVGVHLAALQRRIPPQIDALDQLDSLWLSRVTGPLPADLLAMDQLPALHLIDSELTALPPELGQLTALRDLTVTGDSVTGAIPVELAALSLLQELWLGSALAGTIPAELGGLTELTDLRLEGDLSGSVPPAFGQLTKLTRLQLQDNQLTGVPPAELAGLVDLDELQLQNNLLAGEIPAAFAGSLLNRVQVSGNGCLTASPAVATFLFNLTIGDAWYDGCSPLPFMTADGTYGSNGSDFGELAIPRELAVDDAGRMHVTDSQNDKVVVFEETAPSVWDPVADYGTPGSGVGEMSQPRGIGLDANGQTHVVEWDRDMVLVFAETSPDVWTFQYEYGVPGTGPGQIDRPETIVADASGAMHVLQSGRITVFAETAPDTWTYEYEYGDGTVAGDGPLDLAFDSANRSHVVTNGQVEVFDQTAPTVWTHQFTYAQSQNPGAIDIDDDDRAHLLDAYIGGVYLFVEITPTYWGPQYSYSSGVGPGTPVDVAIDRAGRSHVLDSDDDQVLISS